MSRKYFLISLLLIVSSGFLHSQSYSKVELSNMLKSFFEGSSNVTYLPPEFYDCAYGYYTDGYTDASDLGFIVAQRCVPKFLPKMRFSDKGVKAMAKFGDAFVLNCMRLITEHENTLNTLEYCKCINDSYVKNEIGYDDL